MLGMRQQFATQTLRIHLLGVENSSLEGHRRWCQQGPITCSKVRVWGASSFHLMEDTTLWSWLAQTRTPEVTS